MEETTSLLEQDPLDLSREEMEELLAYPGKFCCGGCPYIIQCPWRCCQCCAGYSTLCCLYLPVFLILWLLSCFHACCCKYCCPAVHGDKPTQYTFTTSTPKLCFPAYCRRFLACWSLRLLNVAPANRGCCWRCLHHYLCWASTIDSLSSGTGEWVHAMRNDFGDVFPMRGGLAVCSYDEGVELVAGKDVYRDNTPIFVGEANSVMAEFLVGAGNSVATHADDYPRRRRLVEAMMQDFWERLRRLGHAGARRDFPHIKSGAEINEKIQVLINNGARDEMYPLVLRIVFYMFTGGDLSLEEGRKIAKAGAYSFLGDHVHWVMGGYRRLYVVADAAQALCAAILRQRKFCNSLIRFCRENNISPVDAIRGVAIAILGAGGLGTNFAALWVLDQIDSDPKYSELFDENPIAFVKEVLRVKPPVKVVMMKSEGKRTFVSGGREVNIYRGDHLTAQHNGVNTNVSVTGRTEMGFWAENVTDPSPQDFETMVTFNGVGAEFRKENFVQSEVSPRICPGRDATLVLVSMIVENMKKRRGSGPRGINSAAALELKGLTDADYAILKPLLAKLASFVPFDITVHPSTYVKLPQWAAGKHCQKDTVFKEFKVLIEDEDIKPESPIVKIGLMLVNAIFDIADTNVPMESPEEAEEWVQIAFGTMWPKTAEVFEFTTDEAHEDLAFLGLGSHLVRRVTDEEKDVPEDCMYLLDATSLAEYGSRGDFVPLGATGFFDKNKKIVGIYVSYLDRIITRGSEEWEHAKFVYRSSVFVYVTFADHVVATHVTMSSALVSAGREFLEPDHPMRRFVKPFTFRTVIINGRIIYRLGGERGLVARAAGLPPTVLDDVFLHYGREFRLQSYADVPAKNGMENEDPIEYSFMDAVDYTGIVRRYVCDYMDVYYNHDFESIRADQSFYAFIQALCQELKVDTTSRFEYDDVVDTLTSVIVGVTGFHKHVGTVAHYLSRGEVGGKVRRGATRLDAQAFVQAAIIGATTGITSPKLMNDWTYLLLDDEHKPQLIEITNRFQDELRDFAGVVEERNRQRRVASVSFYPPGLECAVSV